MKYTIIRNSKQYYKYAEILEKLVTEKGDRDDIDLLTLLIEDYDRRTGPAEIEMDPIDMIKFIMEENRMKDKDLAEILGVGRSYISLLLSRKRRLPLDKAIKLATHWKLDQAVLTRPYQVKRDLEMA